MSINFGELDDKAADFLTDLLQMALENGAAFDHGEVMGTAVKIYQSLVIGDLIMSANPKLEAKWAALEAARGAADTDGGVADAVAMALADPVLH